MFVRKKLNRSGSISIQIIQKQDRKNILLETVGCGKNEKEVEKLMQKAQQRISELNPQQQFDFFTLKDQILSDHLASDEFVSVRNIGPELILGKIFSSIGFDAIPEPLFRHIVMARLTYPVSKLKTTEYLQTHHHITIDISRIYRFLDRFFTKYQLQVQRIVYEHSRHILGRISVVFYDMTTLYFEAENEDDLRKIGFSKDGKFQKPQIMLGLLVGKNGYPIGYDIFEGNTFEGHTLIPILKQIQKKYGLPKPVVIADAGLLSRENLESLSKQKYQFIIGARIKTESDKTKEKIVKKAKNMSDEDRFIVRKKDGTRLVVSYSDHRAKKDVHNRERGLRKLRQRVRTGKLTKENINNRGYNKFLTLDGKVKVTIDEKKIDDDKKWDGLKGYVTNTSLKTKTIIENYRHLWQIEKAFRISKTDLRIRPIHHYRRRRIEAHICIAFAAYAIWKELERLLKKYRINMSPSKTIELSKSIYQISFALPDSGKTKTAFAKLSDNQKLLLRKFHFG